MRLQQPNYQQCLTVHSVITTIFITSTSLLLSLPVITLTYNRPIYNAAKVALLIENRPNPILAPFMLHFMSVIPSDWRFRFLGSPESVAAINKSFAIQQHVQAGKLDLTYIPSNMSTAGPEQISRFLTSLYLYATLLRPAEWLLIFQTDSIICANSRHNLDEFLEYDWIGAPWNPNGQWGGNGGLSLRRVSRIVDILRNQKRIDNSQPEDVWLSERVAHHPRGKVANGSVSLVFSGENWSGVPEQIDPAALAAYNDTAEAIRQGVYVAGIDDWRNGFYEPMGYHTGGSSKYLHSGIWGTPEKRQHIYKYCPEVKMTLAMDLAEFVPGECNANW